MLGFQAEVYLRILTIKLKVVTKSVLLSLLSEAFTIYGLSQCSFTALVLSCCGIFAPASIANFHELDGFVRDLEFLAILCVSEGASMYRFSENSTGHAWLPG